MLYLVDVEKTNAPYRVHTAIVTSAPDDDDKHIVDVAVTTIGEALGYDPAHLKGHAPQALSAGMIYAMPRCLFVAS